MAPQIPDRWLKYKPIGQRVEGTRFIAFKVPLRKQINRPLDESDRLHAELLLEKVPNLGVIIDLTNTNRYYDPNFFKNEGIEHKKLMIPGRITPEPRLVNRFKKLVKQFIQNNSDNDKLIGVHCTHGVNRTGYFICNYMVSEMSIDPSDAIEKFAEARGHRIERENYLKSLHKLLSDEDDADNTSDQKWQTRPDVSSKKPIIITNWRIKTDKLSEKATYRSRPNWRDDKHDRSNTNNTSGERYSWRRDTTVSLDTRSSDRNQKRTQADNCRDQSATTPATRNRASTEYNRHNSYSQHKLKWQFSDSNTSQHANYNKNEYCPNNSNYDRISRTNSISSISDNPTNRRLRTDYYNEPSTSSKRQRFSHYTERQQQQQ